MSWRTACPKRPRTFSAARKLFSAGTLFRRRSAPAGIVVVVQNSVGPASSAGSAKIRKKVQESARKCSGGGKSEAPSGLFPLPSFLLDEISGRMGTHQRDLGSLA